MIQRYMIEIMAAIRVEQCTGVIHTKSAVILQNARALLVNVVAQFDSLPQDRFSSICELRFPLRWPLHHFLDKV